MFWRAARVIEEMRVVNDHTKSPFLGNLSEKIGIHYIGAFTGTRTFLGKRHCVFANVGIGYIRYANEALTHKDHVVIDGNSAAFSADIGYDFFVTRNFAIGLQASMTLGISGYRVNKYFMNEQYKENVSHVDVSLGFRFYK